MEGLGDHGTTLPMSGGTPDHQQPFQLTTSTDPPLFDPDEFFNYDKYDFDNQCRMIEQHLQSPDDPDHLNFTEEEVQAMMRALQEECNGPSKKRSAPVWKHMVLIGPCYKKASCIHCKKELSAKSKNGTSHLNRHVMSCLKEKGLFKELEEFLDKTKKKKKVEKRPSLEAQETCMRTQI